MPNQFTVRYLPWASRPDLIVTGETLAKALRGANLCAANLRGADLYGANLRRANLRGADLNGANLLYADLNGANLRDANLRGANLYGANLRRANLRDADLRGANLRGADLYGANLRDADLRGADLRDADLRGATLPAISIVPEEGSFVAFKKCQEGLIVKLLIPADASRSNATGRKCRASKAEVLEIFGEAECAISTHDGETVYRVGETVHCDTWCEDRWQECAGGIHFFITKAEAEAY